MSTSTLQRLRDEAAGELLNRCPADHVSVSSAEEYRDSEGGSGFRVWIQGGDPTQTKFLGAVLLVYLQTSGWHPIDVRIL